MFVQLHFLHNLMHGLSHLINLVWREEAFDDKEAICLVLNEIFTGVIITVTVLINKRTIVSDLLELL